MASTYESTIDMCVNSLMASVRAYNEEQLQLLLNDDSRLESMLTSLPQLSTLNSDRDTHLTMCKSLAESNLTMEPKFQSLRDKLRISYKELQVIVDEVKQLEVEAKMVEGENNLDSMSVLLQAAIQKTEDEGELIAEQFYEKSVSVDEFVKMFNEKRELYHKRKVKSDKVNEQLRNQQFRPVSEPTMFYPHPATGYRQVGANIYPNQPGTRHSYYN